VAAREIRALVLPVSYSQRATRFDRVKPPLLAAKRSFRMGMAGWRFARVKRGRLPVRASRPNARSRGMIQSKMPNLIMGIIIGLLGIGLITHKGIFAPMEARQAALELHVPISD
jgi:hypothetical protein